LSQAWNTKGKGTASRLGLDKEGRTGKLGFQDLGEKEQRGKGGAERIEAEYNGKEG